MKEKIKSYAFFILSALAVGELSAFFTRNNMDINKDVLMPPPFPTAHPFSNRLDYTFHPYGN